MAVAPILVILGPTASGKTDLALQIARRTGGEILSVDSMQVYRGMGIGTAKPTPQQRREVPHHLIDVALPTEAFTVARYVQLADAAIAKAQLDQTPLIATGGTPLYYKALFEGLFEGPGANADLRDELRSLSNEQLHERLRQVDVAAAEKIHGNDTRRMIRALEVHRLTGKPISSFQTEWEENQSRHPAVWIGIDWERSAIHQRINARVKEMLAAGWVDEVRHLLDAGGFGPTAAEATGYRELIEHLKGNLALEEAVEQIKIATRQLARKQMKWFRRFPNVRWLRGDRPLEELAAEVIRLWRNGRLD